MLRRTARSLPTLLVTLAGLAAGQENPFAVEVTALTEVLESEAEESASMGMVQPGQVYVWHPGGTRLEKVRFSGELGYVPRAALKPLPDQDLYMVASSTPLQVNGSTLKLGTLVAPVDFQDDYARLFVAGKEAWVPRSALRGPVDLPKPPRPTTAAASSRRRARGGTSAPASAPATGTKAEAKAADATGAAATEAARKEAAKAGEEFGDSIRVRTRDDAGPAGADAGEDAGEEAAAPGVPLSSARAPEGPPARSAAPRGRGRVLYNGKTVSSAAVREFLQRVADLTGSTVRVTSGDRNYVPRGGSQRSLHLSHRAADFAVDGQTLGQTFELLRAHRDEILDGGSFEVIWHQAGTTTTNPHLHVGAYPDARASAFKTETRGVYRRVP